MTGLNDHKKNYAGKIILFTGIISFGYAILRYQILGSVPWKDLPFLIFNKGVSLTAFILLTINFSIGPLKNINTNIPEEWLNARRILGMTGFILVVIHVFMSLMLFKPEIYGKFFDPDGSLSLYAGLSMLGGILSFVILWIYNFTFQTGLKENKKFVQLITSRKILLISMLLSLAHIFFMGFKGWMNPAGWSNHGGLPPITLIAFVFFTIGYIINLFGRK